MVLRTQRRGFGSLLREVDRCVTPQGSRLVSDRLLRPSTDVVTVDGRLDTVQWLVVRDTKYQAPACCFHLTLGLLWVSLCFTWLDRSDETSEGLYD